MRILHTMLRVGNLDKSVAFYTDVLGMKGTSKNPNFVAILRCSKISSRLVSLRILNF